MDFLILMYLHSLDPICNLHCLLMILRTSFFWDFGSQRCQADIIELTEKFPCCVYPNGGTVGAPPEESPAAPRSRVPTPHDTAWVCSSLEPCLTLAITLATSKGLSMSSDLLMRVHERSAYRCRGSLRDGGSQVLLTTAKLCFASGMFHGCDRSSTANMFTEKTTKCQTC